MPGMVPVRACALPAATNLMMTCRRGHDVLRSYLRVQQLRCIDTNAIIRLLLLGIGYRPLHVDCSIVLGSEGMLLLRLASGMISVIHHRLGRLDYLLLVF